MNDETAPSSLNNTENANNTQREEIISKNFPMRVLRKMKLKKKSNEKNYEPFS